VRDHPAGREADDRRANAKSDEHHGDEQRTAPFRHVLREQRRRVGHRGAEADTRQEAHDHHLGHVLRERGEHGADTEGQDCGKQDSLASEAIGGGSSNQRADDQANWRGAHHEAEARA